MILRNGVDGVVGRLRREEVGAIDQEENLGLAALHVGGESRRDHDAGPRLARVDHLDHSALVGRIGSDIEEAGGGHRGDELAAGVIQALIRHRRRDVLDVHRDGVAQQEKLHDGDRQLDRQRAPVAQGLDELLLHHGPNPLPHRVAPSLENREKIEAK